MLYWFWFVFLSLLGWFFAYRNTNTVDSGIYATVLLPACSLIISAPVLVVPLYGYILANLPASGELITGLSAKAIVFVGCFAWVSMPLIVADYLDDMIRKKKRTRISSNHDTSKL